MIGFIATMNPMALAGILSLLVAFLALVLFRGVVGPTSNADGTTPLTRQDKQGGTVVQQTRGKYHEATLRGNVFSATTAATGVAPGTALGTTAAFCLYNPATSGKLLSVNKVSMGLISGTLGAGTVWITGFAAGDAVPTGTAITPKSKCVGSSNASVATALTTATVTTTAGKMLDIFCSLNEGVVATTAINNEVISKDIDGEIVVMPGYGICIHATAAAGSSPLVVYSVSWEEITVV